MDLPINNGDFPLNMKVRMTSQILWKIKAMFETTNQLLNMGLIINHHKISQVGVDGVRIIDQGWHLRGV